MRFLFYYDILISFIGGFMLYDELGNCFNYNEKQFAYESRTADIYQINSELLLKIIFSQFSLDLMNPEIFNIIQMLRNKNFCKIDKLLYDYERQFKAYTMKYYDSDIEDILDIPIEYTLESFNSIQQMGKKLTERNIYMRDLFFNNVILNQNGIIVIDFDNYEYSEFFAKNNKQRINETFKDLYYLQLMDYNLSIEVANELATRVFNEESTIDTVYPILKKYKKPIDYFRKFM